MRKNKRNKPRHGNSITALMVAVSVTGMASAQDTAPEANPDENKVVITGSRLASGGYLAPTPVTVVDQQELKLSGTQNLEVLLSDTPQFTANQLSSPTANTVQAGQPSGTSTLNLRNLGPTRNLVLVNGRRFAITGPDFTTDINTIPSALVKRIETVTGGSSAVYGSDAISGVVNFIMRDNFEGVEVNAQRTWDQPSKTPTKSLDLTVGGNFANNKGNVVLSVNYMDRQGITRADRGRLPVLARRKRYRPARPACPPAAGPAWCTAARPQCPTAASATCQSTARPVPIRP
jgi:iron complex outermembrane receptor protein